MKNVKISVIGFGTVGAGVVENILANGGIIAKRTGVNLELTHVADLDTTSDRGVKLPAGVLINDAAAAIAAADIVVELVGGTTVAKKFILDALRQGKSVVTANKALLAKYGPELFAAAKAGGGDLFFEASVAGGIPIIKALREGLVSNRISRIYGIMNGTCNYILTRMEREQADFAPILADAQKLGYAEADPSLDIDGFDTAHKASILASLAYGKWFGMDNIFVSGIRDLELVDLHYADELGYRIKLLAIIKSVGGKVQMRVHPTLILKNELLANISDVFNGVMVEGDTVDKTLFYGRGAGRRATASAVVADITDAALNIAAGNRQRIAPFTECDGLFDGLTPLDEVSSRYYLRFQVADRPGVVAAMSQALAENNISISSVIQHEIGTGSKTVAVVVLTHSATEKAMNKALEKIEQSGINTSPVRLIRIEDI